MSTSGMFCSQLSESDFKTFFKLPDKEKSEMKRAKEKLIHLERGVERERDGEMGERRLKGIKVER